MVDGSTAKSKLKGCGTALAVLGAGTLVLIGVAFLADYADNSQNHSAATTTTFGPDGKATVTHGVSLDQPSVDAPKATAETMIDDHTTCATARAVMDAPQPDMQQVRAVTKYIESALSTIDHLYAAKGEPAIIARMSDEGRSKTIAVVTVRCGHHPEETIQTSAIAVYDGLKGLGQDLGIDPPAAEPSHSGPHNDIVMDVSVDQLLARMNEFEGEISEPRLQKVSEISNDEVFTRTFKISDSASLIVVQNKKLAKIRDASLVWSSPTPADALAGALQLGGLIGAISPTLTKPERAHIANELFTGLNDNAPVSREFGSYRITCTSAMFVFCAANSKDTPAD